MRVILGFLFGGLLFGQSASQQLLISQKIAAGGASPTFVQAVCSTGLFVGTNYSLTSFTATTGNVLYVFFSQGASVGGTVTASSTSGGSPSGDTFTAINTNSQTFQNTYDFRAINIHGGAYVITVNSTIGASTGSICAMEFSGLTAFDQNCVSTSTTAAACNTSMTPTASPAVIVAGIGDYYRADTFTAGSGYTIPSGGTVASGTDGSPGSMAVEYQICSSSCGTAFTPSFGVTGTNYSTVNGGSFK